jgi:hypothetical protein
MQHPHHRSLGNLVTTGQPPGTSTRGPFYGTQNIVFHICAPATSWSANVYHNGPRTTCFSQTTFLRNECPAIWMQSLQIPFGVQTCTAAALLRSASPYSNIICQFVEWILRILRHFSIRTIRAILWFLTCLPQCTPQHQNINSSDLVRVCRLNDCFIRFAVLPRSCHISLKKRLRPYVYMDVSACL